MLLMIKLSARKYAVVNAPTVGGYHGLASYLGQPEGVGIELGSVTLISAPYGDLIGTGSYSDCLDLAGRWAVEHKRTIQHTDWEQAHPNKNMGRG